ncbi:MAG TPA: hypothetical protein VKE22_20730 [Haliangiales bacterium]|nr:hypothetical protein [Haliangiales bacterium]
MFRALACAILLASLPASAQTTDIFPLSKVRPGMKGYGLTTIQGQKPIRFDFEVIGIARNFLPKTDIILVKSEDPQLALTGFARGMSGSPLFLDGKIACAFSYAFRFSKLSMGGCTPIEYMLEAATHKPRGDNLATVTEFQKATAAPSQAYLLRPPLPAPPKDQPLVQADIPLAISGLGPRAFGEARKIFAPFDLEPMQGLGGGGDLASGSGTFELGGNIHMVFASGDFTAGGTCAVSYIEKDLVLGCGHPLMGMGESYMPVATAEVQFTVPTLDTSFKLAYPVREAGALVQDRLAAVVADTSKRVAMIPVRVTVKNNEGLKVFSTNVIANRFLTPQLATLAVANAVQVMSPDMTDATLTVKSTLSVKGFGPLAFTDYLYSAEGASLAALSTARGLRVLVPLLFNPYEPVKLEKIEIDAQIAYKADFAEIIGVRLPELQLPAGKPTYVDVVLRPFNAPEYTQRVPLTIPDRLAGATVKIEVLPGDQARPDAAPPKNLGEIIDVFRTKTFPANVLVATVYTSEEGVTLGGRVLPDLPDSALDTARPATATRRADAYRSILRSKIPLSRVATGRQEIVVKIADLK